MKKTFNESVTLDEVEKMYGKGVANALVEYCDKKGKTPDEVVNSLEEDKNGMTPWDKFDVWAKAKGIDVMDKFSDYDYSDELEKAARGGSNEDELTKFPLGYRVIHNGERYEVVDIERKDGKVFYCVSNDDEERRISEDELASWEIGGDVVSEGTTDIDTIDNDDGTTTLTRECPFCHKPNKITLPMSLADVEDGLYAWKMGAYIQDAFPNLKPDEREFLKTGICNDCWDTL